MLRLSSTFAGYGLVILASCQPRVDIPALSQELLETDQAWAKLASTNGPTDSIVAYWTPDARVVLPGQAIVVGTNALRQMVTAMQAIPGFHISWTPDSAIISSSGDLGYTYGTNQITMPDSAGVPQTARARYVTVWRKEAKGRWRCALEISNEGPAASASL